MLPDKQDYAAFRQTIMAFMIVTPFLTMGVGKGLYYYLPTEQDRNRGRIIDAILIVITMATIFGLFLYFGGNEVLAKRFKNPKVASLLLLLIPMCFAHAIMRLVAPILTILERIYSLTVFNIISRVMIGFMTICPVLIWINPTAPLIGMTVGTAIASLAGVGLIYWYIPKDEFKPSYGTIKELLSFSLPLGIGGMIGALNLQLDKLIVSSMCSPDEFAVFSNGAIEIPLIGVMTGSIVAVLMVEMRKAVADGRKQEALELFRKTAVQTSYVLFPAAIFLMIFADSFVSVLFSERYSDATLPFRLYLLLIPIRTVSFGALLVALGLKNVILFRGIITLVLNSALSVLLVSFLGPIGAVVSTVTAVIIWAVPCNLFFLSSKLGVSWSELLPLSKLGMLIVHLLLPMLFLLVLEQLTRGQNHFTRLCLAALVTSAYLGWWWNGKIYKFPKTKFLA